MHNWNEDVRDYRRWSLIAHVLDLLIPILLLYVVARPLSGVAVRSIGFDAATKANGASSIRRVISELRSRANRAETRLLVSLLLILGGAVLSGITLFAYAGEIAREEERRGSAMT